MTKLPSLLVRLQSRLVHHPPLARCMTNDLARRWSTTAAASEESSSSSSPSSRSGINKERILESALKQVPFYGWTQDAIVAGIQQDFPSGTASLSMAGLFTPRDLVRLHMDRCNQRLRLELPHHLKNSLDTITISTLEDNIASAFRLRLEYSKHFIEQSRWHEGMALGVSSSDQAWTTTEQLKDIVDIVVDACSVVMSGQDNTSNNDTESSSYQPRVLSDLERIALGGIYVATELHMLTDTSPDYQDTWDFLRQRMNEWNIVSSSVMAGVMVGLPPVFASGTSASFGVGDALLVGRTLTTAFASAAASVLQVNPPYSTSK